jgi:hypothetical protein
VEAGAGLLRVVLAPKHRIRIGIRNWAVGGMAKMAGHVKSTNRKNILIKTPNFLLDISYYHIHYVLNKTYGKRRRSTYSF